MAKAGVKTITGSWPKHSNEDTKMLPIHKTTQWTETAAVFKLWSIELLCKICFNHKTAHQYRNENMAGLKINMDFNQLPKTQQMHID